jgi:hypothetical protein
MTGLWQLLPVIGFIILVFGMLYTISTMIPIPVEALQSISNSYLFVSAILWITIPITIILGYYSYKVGVLYGIGSLKLTGICNIILTLAYPVLFIGLTQFVQLLSSILPSPPVNYPQLMQAWIGLLLIGGVFVCFFGIVSLIGFILGSSAMKKNSGIGKFGRAMWLSIVGLLVWFLIPIAIVEFGSGLGKLSKPNIARPTSAAKH